MRHFLHVLAVMTLALSPALLAGCAETPPSRFYALTPLPADDTPHAANGIATGVGPVAMPQYLDRPEIVTRTGANGLALAEFDRWGGRLEDNFTRVLAENLSVLLATDRVLIYPWSEPTPIDYQVSINVTGFEQDIDGAAVLTAFWSVLNGSDGHVLLTRRSSLREPTKTAALAGLTAGSRYDAIVTAMSKTLAGLSREIADAVKGLTPG